jgi:hypothetical protein
VQAFVGVRVDGGPGKKGELAVGCVEGRSWEPMRGEQNTCFVVCLRPVRVN